MSLTDMVIMPGADYQATCDAIREKTEGVGYICSGDMAELIRSIETGGGGKQFVLPIGRSRGDINGDGHITNADRVMMNNHLISASELTDPVELWCADINGDGSVDVGDMIAFSKYFAGTDQIHYAADYYGNWTYESGDTGGYYYIDVPVEGVTADSVVTLLVSSRADTIKSVIPLDGKIRVTATVCPGVELSCSLLIHEEGERMDSVPVPEPSVSNLFPVKVINNGTVGVFYFSRNHKEGISIPSGTELVDELNPWEMYSLLYDSNATRGLEYKVGDLYPLFLEGPFSIAAVGDKDCTGVYDTFEMFTVDPSEKELIIEVRKPR